MNRSETLCTCLALLLTLAVATPAAADPVGFVANVAGDGEVLPVGAPTWERALIDRDVAVDDGLRTAERSALRVLLVDETLLTLGEATELVLDEFLVGAAAQTDASVLKMLKGRARAVISDAYGPSNVELHTPTAVIGVKGTSYDVYIVGEGAQAFTVVCTVTGHIFVRHVDPAISGLVEPPVGRCVEVFQDRLGDVIDRPSSLAPVEDPFPTIESGLTDRLLFGRSGVGSGQAGGDRVSSWLAVRPSGLPGGIGLPTESGAPEDMAQTTGLGVDGSPLIFEGPGDNATQDPPIFEGPGNNAGQDLVDPEPIRPRPIEMQGPEGEGPGQNGQT